MSQLHRLMKWLEAFKPCFGHRAQVLALRRYVQGLLSDSARKSMEAMLARVTDPGSYQAFQHFITDAPWKAEQVWRQLRTLIPEREGLLIFDGTSFPKQGTASVGVARQYCGALGKIANCQVATTVALWTKVRAYVLGAALYLPEEWLTEEARERARIPKTVRFQEKWRQAVTLLREVRASGFTVSGVLADAEFGDVGLFRAFLHRLRLPYAVGISSNVTVFLGSPKLVWYTQNARGRPRKHPELAAGVKAIPVSTVMATTKRRWRRISWRHRRDTRRGTVNCTAIRVTPAHDWRHRRLARSLVVDQAGCRRHAEDQVFLGEPAGLRTTAADRPLRASALGHRTAVPRTEDRTRARSLRRAHVSRLASSRGADRDDLQLPASRAMPLWHDADLSCRTGNCPRDFHRVSVRPTTEVSQAHRDAPVGSVTDLTKSY